jgi:hypothetical protein
VQEFGQLFFGNYKRRQEHNDITQRAQNHSALPRFQYDLVPCAPGKLVRLLRLRVFDKLNSNHEPALAHIAHVLQFGNFL